MESSNSVIALACYVFHAFLGVRFKLGSTDLSPNNVALSFGAVEVEEGGETEGESNYVICESTGVSMNDHYCGSFAVRLENCANNASLLSTTILKRSHEMARG
jgi:hypothetical protein